MSRDTQWVLLKRREPSYNEVILVNDVVLVCDGMYQFSGDSGKWVELARGSDADYEMLLNMAKLTDNYVELGVNRKKNIDLYYEKRGEEYNKC